MDENKPTHTPGPLTSRLEATPSWRKIEPAYQIVGPSQSGVTSRTVYGGAFKRADADLWAAAPDMLAALKQAYERIPWKNGVYKDIATQVRAAIAKAEGR